MIKFFRAIQLLSWTLAIVCFDFSYGFFFDFLLCFTVNISLRLNSLGDRGSLGRIAKDGKGKKGKLENLFATTSKADLKYSQAEGEKEKKKDKDKDKFEVKSMRGLVACNMNERVDIYSDFLSVLFICFVLFCCLVSVSVLISVLDLVLGSFSILYLLLFWYRFWFWFRFRLLIIHCIGFGFEFGFGLVSIRFLFQFCIWISLTSSLCAHREDVRESVWHFERRQRHHCLHCDEPL
jgi:hypothetical protein